VFGDDAGDSEAVAIIFDVVANCHGFRTTAGAKILGVVNPSLFVMWDDSIALRYLSGGSHIFDGQGDALFLRRMEKVAHLCLIDFNLKSGHHDLAAFLSERLEVSPPLTLAKYLDEYNWITITKGIRLPLKWHPCVDSMAGYCTK